eukprot:Gregarina_sp_Poly_1__588@NODE_113_length_13886_cov_267_363051_g100_i0_p7_GENE_NODE_113_length_13886_cov_267_363051_g100_i0NODE_113_length_13886_cov_267_363051_g100_i0_p7_ORF_typecomplete_len297_score21_73_NODE_113_length_13886_cov_267_363051_g100_i088189708
MNFHQYTPPQVQSSSRTTTVRTTQTTSGRPSTLIAGGLGATTLGGLGTPMPSLAATAMPTLGVTNLMPTGLSTTQYVSAPTVTQTRYATTSGPVIAPVPMMTTTTTTTGKTLHSPGIIKTTGLTPGLSGYSTLGNLSLARPATYVTTSLPMGLATGPATTSMQTATSNQITYSNSASLTINDVRCEGYIAVSNDRIVEAKNLFVGSAPFVLSQETLEVTPEMTVVARNPDIKHHISELPNAECESLTLSELRRLAGMDENAQLWIGLPGQAASAATESHGGIHFHTTASFAPAFHA